MNNPLLPKKRKGKQKRIKNPTKGSSGQLKMREDPIGIPHRATQELITFFLTKTKMKNENKNKFTGVKLTKICLHDHSAACREGFSWPKMEKHGPWPENEPEESPSVQVSAQFQAPAQKNVNFFPSKKLVNFCQLLP